MPFGGFGEPIWHQNWKEERQKPHNNPSEFRSARDFLVILAFLGGAVGAVILYAGLLAWWTGRPFP